jgi:RNA polymerase sigma factor (sigma-70 family)
VPPTAAEPAQDDRADRAAKLVRAHWRLLRRQARRFSLCDFDGDEALGRAIEILLTKAPAIEPQRLLGWMLVVVRREALAVRRERQRSFGAFLSPPGSSAAPLAPDTQPSLAPGPFERLERTERTARARRLLARLKAHERRALALQAEGYSYAEIQEITGWTYTKVNRCISEGRARLRQLAG